MAVAESFRIYPNLVRNLPSVKEQDYIAHSGRFQDHPIPYMCTNTGRKRCQEGECKPPKEPLRASLEFMTPAEIIQTHNFCRHKRWISPCYRMVSKYNAKLPYTQDHFNNASIERYPPFSPMMTTCHMDYRDFTDDEVLLKEKKKVVDRAKAEAAHRQRMAMLQSNGFVTPWSDSKYGTNCLFLNYPSRLQPRQQPQPQTQEPQPPAPRREYRATPVLDIHRQKIRRFPPNLIPSYSVC